MLKKSAIPLQGNLPCLCKSQKTAGSNRRIETEPTLVGGFEPLLLSFPSRSEAKDSNDSILQRGQHGGLR